MEDNSSGDDDIQESPSSPKSGGKKIKLNDGSSQDSIKDSASSSKADNSENVDSGVSVDKSESTSSDDRTAGGWEGPSNQLIIAAPSTSNVRAILLNFRRPKRGQNYRKRKTPGRDSDSSNSTSTDSDDISAEEIPVSRPQNSTSNSDTESDDLQRLFSSYEPTNESHSMPDSSSESNASYDSDQMIQIQSSESDDGDLSSRNGDTGDENEENNENQVKLNRILLKTRPKHNYLLLREIINRELGVSLRTGTAMVDENKFEKGFYGSLHAVYRMKKLHNLNKHRGCVNSIHFHPEGRLLASGSDDMSVVVWDWARRQVLHTIKTGHKSNVFQSKFMYLNAQSQLNIVTCARDGQVRLVQCHASGGCGSSSRRRLACHSRAAHKLHVCAADPHSVLSAGEDGLVMHCDVRDEHANKLFQVKEKGSTIPLYSVHGHPLDPKQLVVAGRDKFVRVYDRRKSNKVVAMYCPTPLLENVSPTQKAIHLSIMHLTCAVYNHDGSEILGSYNDEDIYLFDTKNDVYDKDNTNELKDGYTHRYSGHRNSATFKGVAFFGPKSEYIVSGSDCSYIYIWDKKTESIVQWLKGDANGVVNCIEPHPRCPVLATSGLDKDVKIWMPNNDTDPTYDGLERVVKDNSTSLLRSPLFNDFLPSLYSAWRGENRAGPDDDNSFPYGGNIEFEGNVCTTF